MATTLELIRDMPKGKSLTKKAPGRFLTVRHDTQSGQGFHVFASWLTNESYDSDPESFTCECEFRFKSHCHMELGSLTAERATEVYESAKEDFSSNLQMSFGKITFQS